MKVFQSFLPFFASLAFANDEASYTEDVGGLFRTMEEHPERVALHNIDGTVPEWLKGSMFRNGPGQYEYGTDHFRHIFDPSAIIQKIEFDNGNVHYQSKYIESTHRLANVEKNAIVYSEMGTWAEPEGYEELEDDELSLARCLHLYESFPSDNTIVSLYPIHGWMVGFTESRMVTLNDPETLETKHVLDLGKSAPEGYFIITVLAHGSLDGNGDFWTMSVGVQKESYAFMPKTAYGTLKIKNAVRDVENPFAYQASPEEFLASVEFGDSLYNEDERDRTVRYFHMFVQTPEYLVLPVTSIELDPAKLTDACKNGQPPMDMMLYNEEKPGYFKIFDKKNMKWFPKTFATEAFMQIHMIQAYVDAEKNKIIFDTCETPKGDIMMAYYLETVNATGQALQEAHESMLPIGVPVRYEFGLDGLTAKTEEYVEPTVLFEPDMENWPMYTAAGTDFPMINFDYLGVEYDHFWSNGMGNVMADRLYHSQISTGDRHVWREVGYSPSEPFFVSRPGATSETDGVLLSLVSAFEGHSHLRPFMLILDPIEMTEIARIWLPEDYDISVSFHGTFVKH